MASQFQEDDAAATARRKMVAAQIVARGIVDERVISAMLQVPREYFVPEDVVHLAYEDRPLPIGHSQTISQPYTVAFQCQSLQLSGGERVLEIGTGSGYAAAVLSYLADEIFTIERIPELAADSRLRLEQLGYRNVHVYAGDGSLGLASKAPYDAIVCTAGAPHLPDALAEQLADGGRLVIPIGETPHGQIMTRFTRTGAELRPEELGPFAFVPLVGRQAWRLKQGSGDE